MPTKPLKSCAVSGWPNLTSGTYCEKHRRKEIFSIQGLVAM